jgi:hypothetical protein
VTPNARNLPGFAALPELVAAVCSLDTSCVANYDPAILERLAGSRILNIPHDLAPPPAPEDVS